MTHPTLSYSHLQAWNAIAQEFRRELSICTEWNDPLVADRLDQFESLINRCLLVVPKPEGAPSFPVPLQTSNFAQACTPEDDGDLHGFESVGSIIQRFDLTQAPLLHPKVKP
jgi:hypothetical protein